MGVEDGGRLSARMSVRWTVSSAPPRNEDPLAHAMALVLFTYFHPGVRTRRGEEEAAALAAAEAAAKAAEAEAADALDEPAAEATTAEVVDLEARRRAHG